MSDLFDPEDVAENLELAQEPEANTYLPPSRQMEFPGFLPPLADVLPAAADSLLTSGPQQPAEMRDTSGQEAGQPSFLAFNQKPKTENRKPSFLAFNQKPKTENRKPSFKRDRCGTEAGQTAPYAEESKPNQSVKQEAEKFETTPATPRKTAARHRKSPSRNPKLETPPQESLCDRLRRKLAQTPAPAAPGSCNSEQLYQQYLREKAAALAYLNSPPASDEAQLPPPETLSPEESPAPPDAACHRPTDGSDPSPETGNQKPETGAPAPAPRDRYAGYFKFPGDYPPGYLFAVTHGYWPDDPPEHIPDRRWEEDFGSAGRFGKTKGTY